MNLCFVGKVMSLLFNMLSRFVITFLPRNKHLLISLLQSPSTVILESKKLKPVTVSILSLSICHEVMEPDSMPSNIFWMLNFKPAFSVFYPHQEALSEIVDISLSNICCYILGINSKSLNFMLLLQSFICLFIYYYW